MRLLGKMLLWGLLLFAAYAALVNGALGWTIDWATGAPQRWVTGGYALSSPVPFYGPLPWGTHVGAPGVVPDPTWSCPSAKIPDKISFWMAPERPGDEPRYYEYDTTSGSVNRIYKCSFESSAQPTPLQSGWGGIRPVWKVGASGN